MGTIDITGLSVEERLRLLDEIWESLSETPEAFPLTAAQAEELNRRVEDMNRDGSPGTPWEDVVKEIRGRKR